MTNGCEKCGCLAPHYDCAEYTPPCEACADTSPNAELCSEHFPEGWDDVTF